MARSIWSGSVSFGLVNVPIKLYSAQSENTVSFKQLNGKTGNKISQKRFDSVTDEEVPYEDLVKGYEITPNRFITITSEELDAIAPVQTKSLVIEQFVPLAEIDPRSFGKSYYLGPADATSPTGRAYALLAAAIEDTATVGVGRVILRSKESLAALRSVDGVLTLTLLLFADEVLSAEKVVGTVEGAYSEAEVAMAKQLVTQLTRPWDAAAFRDEYRERVLELVESKAAGEMLETPAAEEKPETADLLAALEASLAA